MIEVSGLFQNKGVNSSMNELANTEAPDETDEQSGTENPDRITFKVENCRGKIKGVNPRKENHGDELVTAVDLKIEVECGIEVSDALLGAQDGHASKFLEGLYDGSGALQYWAISNINYSCDYEDCYVVVGKQKIKSAKLTRFHVEPTNMRQCKLTFTASFRPEKGQLEKCVELLMRDVEVSAEPPPDLFNS